MKWNGRYSLRALLGLVTASAVVFGLGYAPTTFDVRYDTNGYSNRIYTQVGNQISVIAVDDVSAAYIDISKKIVVDAPVVDVILNDDNIDIMRIRVTVWQKLALCWCQEKIWMDANFESAGPIYPSK